MQIVCNYLMQNIGAHLPSPQVLHVHTTFADTYQLSSTATTTLCQSDETALLCPTGKGRVSSKLADDIRHTTYCTPNGINSNNQAALLPQGCCTPSNLAVAGAAHQQQL
jgi:hypothetical protein